ncbi:NADP-specific glutamate dehydrogenase [Parahaliea mediterranea]|uniref:Glutamate dehydrogenase n=1 Tax=Parahaliea mediterranea TaxID=651086 RepID=A0A939IKK6_9GAMM|nr:NADP-specific glutamate dehydrogenase [Parahaliea mediterranea]MBN7795062.1 NADP-specific glutamate dehydrogenase [Parahaliea mediterranea]
MNAQQVEDLTSFMEAVVRRNPGEPEFHQAVHEVAMDIIPYLADKPLYRDMMVLERMTEPDRIISFRVVWQDDHGGVQVNRGYRVQQNNAIGPYKGGLRFHPTVTQSVLKFLAFEQVFKNSLTGLPLGGGKGGSDFDPKGKSDLEVMRFCQAFMTELSKHVGPDTDVPAGDTGVGAREVGYLFGQYKRLVNRFEGVLTGKALEFGGSRIRAEATGYGVVYMMQDMLAHHHESIDGRTCVVSGSGNVATYCAEKLIQLGGKVVTLSDSSGYIHDPEGLTLEKLQWVMELKNKRRGRIEEYAREYGVEYHAGEHPWGVPCDLAFPCATQNEIDGAEARTLIENGCRAVAEGANMPTTPDAIKVLRASPGLLHAPSKAANAGGVAVSGLEMSQNSLRMQWSREEVDKHLREIIASIHAQCVEFGTASDGHVDYFKGANIAGFNKVASAMLAYGVM